MVHRGWYCCTSHVAGAPAQAQALGGAINGEWGKTGCLLHCLHTTLMWPLIAMHNAWLLFLCQGFHLHRWHHGNANNGPSHSANQSFPGVGSTLQCVGAATGTLLAKDLQHLTATLCQKTLPSGFTGQGKYCPSPLPPPPQHPLYIEPY